MKISWFFVAMVSFMFLAGSPAGAFTVYNDTGNTIAVQGGDCSDCYKAKIKAGDQGACPGDKAGCAGNTFISFQVPGINCNLRCNKKTPANGWVTISTRQAGKKGLRARCDVYDEKGNELTAGNPWCRCR
ncbi:MAG: hypothetical protein L3J03_00825 [Desulfobacterales bacterium]|nr:hypothetical protein [Desulfobacterales bacterium]